VIKKDKKAAQMRRLFAVSLCIQPKVLNQSID
jgi:hypothetical protein